MKACIVAFLLYTVAMISQTDPKLPTTWTKDLVIEFSYTGSMDGSRTEGRITYDSCILKYQAGHKPSVKGSYRMKESDRTAIIKRLHELKADKITGKASKVPVDDGWSQSIRIGDIWLSGGTSIEMKEEDRLRFGEVYKYLETFALKKATPK